MSYEIKGTIKLIDETQIFGSGFSKREFVVTTDGKYPQDIKFEAVKEKCDDLFDDLDVGYQVNVGFNIRGNEYKGRYYVNLQAWKIDVLSKATIGDGPSGSTSSLEDIEENIGI